MPASSCFLLLVFHVLGSVSVCLLSVLLSFVGGQLSTPRGSPRDSTSVHLSSRLRLRLRLRRLLFVRLVLTPLHSRRCPLLPPDPAQQQLLPADSRPCSPVSPPWRTLAAATTSKQPTPMRPSQMTGRRRENTHRASVRNSHTHNTHTTHCSQRRFVGRATRSPLPLPSVRPSFDECTRNAARMPNRARVRAMET